MATFSLRVARKTEFSYKTERSMFFFFFFFYKKADFYINAAQWMCQDCTYFFFKMTIGRADVSKQN